MAKFLGLLEREASFTVVPKHIDEALTRATIRWTEYESVRVDWTEVEVRVKMGMFKQDLCEEVISSLLECFM